MLLRKAEEGCCMNDELLALHRMSDAVHHADERNMMANKELIQEIVRRAFISGFNAHKYGESCAHGHRPGDHHWETGDCQTTSFVERRMQGQL
jgi:hypothetical protein